jgi:hypothetical protein
MRQGKHLDEKGNICYYKDGELHRDNDLPAVEWDNETKFWYQNGLKHRDNDLPAAVYSNGDRKWYQNGKISRLSGPAEIYANGQEYYWVNGKHLTEKKHEIHPEVRRYRKIFKKDLREHK